MKINLNQLSNSEVVAHVNEQIAQYEQEKEKAKSTGYAIYNGVSLADFQVYDKQLQRCLFAQTDGAYETRDKVKQILANDGGIEERKYTDVSLYEYHKKPQQINRFFDMDRR